MQGSVLLLGDGSALGSALALALEAAGFEVSEARHGELDPAKLRAHAPDLALLDINLPAVGGVSICAKLRELYPGLPIIVLSAHATEADKVVALDAGADDYVTKPFSLAELAARMRACIRRTRPTHRRHLPQFQDR